MGSTIKITGVAGTMFPLAHLQQTPMPMTEAGKSYEVPRTAYYVRAWKRGDIACDALDAEHGKTKVKAKTEETTDTAKAGK